LLHTVEDLEEHSEASVDALIAEFLASPGIQLPGARRLLWLDGEPSLYVALRNQSPARAHVILRVLQELIANAAKHGQGDVTLRIGDEPAGLLTFEVTNEIAAQYGGASGNGIGITGCAVLLEGIGATLESCRSDTDGSGCWRATITVPRSEGDE